MKHNDYTIVEKMELRASIVSLRDDGIVQMDMKAVDEFSMEDAHSCAEAIKQIAKNKKIALLGTINYYVSMDKDVREFWASEVLETCVKCEAFVIENVSMKMIVKFYILFNKPKRRTQLFTSEKSAIAWLKECPET
jgi:hypothetical protein